MKKHLLAKFFFGLLILAAAILPTSHEVFCLPEPDAVVSGQAEFTYPDAATLNINATDKAIVNYKTFNLKENESVYINLPSVNNEMLNRVIGDSASEILGKITCNGIFILVNQNGIYFGPNSEVNAAGMIASTRDITNSDFLSSKYIFGKMSKEQMDMLLLNEGKINIQKGGFGVLIAGAVENKGTITCPMGTIVMAGGDLVRLDISANGLVSVAIDMATAATVYDYQGKPVADQIKNTGTLQADGGMIILAAESLPGIFEKAINLDGYVKADKVDNTGGVVKLVSSGKIVVNTNIQADQIIIGDKEAGIIPQEVVMPEVAEPKKLIATDTVSVAADRIIINSVAPVTEIYKPDSIDLTQTEVKDNVVTLEGTDVKVTYLKENKITLQTDHSVNANPGVIIPAQEVKIMAQRVGTIDNPLHIEADTTYIKIDGDIDLLEMQGMGSSIFARGPPDGFGAIIYNNDSHLILDANKVTLGTTDPSYLLGNITFYNFECNTAGKEIYFETGKTYEFAGDTYIGVDHPDWPVYLKSSEAGNYWYIDLNGTYKFEELSVQDSYNLGAEILYAHPARNEGHNYNWNLNTVTWTGATDSNWSTVTNWAPFGSPATQDVEFTAGAVASSIDVAYTGASALSSLKIDGYAGTITQNANLAVTGNFTQNTGTFTDPTPTAHTFTVGGGFNLTGGTFNRYTGTGTIFVPYDIRDVYDLQAMICDPTATYKLNNNIDATSTNLWNAGAGFMPIGNAGTPFIGTAFYGNNKTINGLYINRTNIDEVGLFGYIGAGASVYDLGLTNVNFTATSANGADGTPGNNGDSGVTLAMGALAGVNEGGVTNCYATGTINGTSGNGGTGGVGGGGSDGANGGNGGELYIGGLFGSCSMFGWLSSVDSSYSTVNVTGVSGNGGTGGNGGLSWGPIAGIGGQGGRGGEIYAGGLAGENRGRISNSYSTGNLTVTSGNGGDGGPGGGGPAACNIGGNAGDGGNIYAGGFIGQMFNPGFAGLGNSYATGNITATAGNGGNGGLGGTKILGGAGGGNGGNGGNAYVAGFVSRTVADIWDSYSTGSLTLTVGGGGTGGLGNLYAPPGADGVAGTNTSGGFLADNSLGGIMHNSFWDTDTSGQATSAGGTGKTTVEMHQQATFVGWDFTNTWVIDENASYPYFIYQAYLWTGGGDGVSWDDPLNWNKITTFPSAAGDRVYIKNNIADISTPAGAGLTLGYLQLGPFYTGTITLNNSLTLDTSAGKPGDLIISSGTINTNNQIVNVDNDFTLTGNTFTQSRNMTIGGDYNQTGGIFNQNADLTINGNYTQTAGAFNQNANLTINGDYSGGGTFLCTDPLHDTFTLAGSFGIPTTANAFNRFTGSGTAADPYIIRTLYDLQAVQGFLTSDFKLNNDIDASSTATWNGGEGFYPIGGPFGRYSGTFDGSGYTISGLTALRTSVDPRSAGLFSEVGTTTIGLTNYIVSITNLALRDVNIWGFINAGGLTGRFISAGPYTGIINNCSVTGQVAGFGGFAGGDPTAGFGGLVGYNGGGIITSCSANVTVNCGMRGGGFVGYNKYGGPGTYMQNCYAYGDVTGNGAPPFGDYYGGFVGLNESPTIIDLFAFGTATGPAGSSFGPWAGYSMYSPIYTRVLDPDEATRNNPKVKTTGEEGTKGGVDIGENPVAGMESAGPGFNYNVIYEEGAKRINLYTQGKYRTTVIVIEGKVVVAPADVKGVYPEKSVTLTADNPKVFFDAVIPGNVNGK